RTRGTPTQNSRDVDLEDVDPLLRRQPHAVTLDDAECGVEGVDVARRVRALVGGGVRVDGEQSLGLRLARLAAPDLRPGEEEALLPGQVVDDRRGLSLIGARGDPVCAQRAPE